MENKSPVTLTLADAIRALRDEYTKARRWSFVQKPLSYALYQTWKLFNRAERSRRKEELETKLQEEGEEE